MRALLACVLLVGCATAPSGPREGFSGTWAGSYSAGPSSGPFELDVVQRGTEVTGQGRASNGVVWFTGTVDGRRVYGTITSQMGRPMVFDVTVTGDTAEGAIGQGTITLKRR